MPSRKWCVFCVTLPMAFAATSESVPERSWMPSSIKRARKLFVFTSVPLCASAISVSSMAEMCGCAASHDAAAPLVEYRACPTATKPSSAASRASSNTCVTRPKSFETIMVSPSPTAMPADSCPRCCSACKPKHVMRATSSPGANTPNTAHSSSKRSGRSPGRTEVLMLLSPLPLR